MRIWTESCTDVDRVDQFDAVVVRCGPCLGLTWTQFWQDVEPVSDLDRVPTRCGQVRRREQECTDVQSKHRRADRRGAAESIADSIARCIREPCAHDEPIEPCCREPEPNDQLNQIKLPVSPGTMWTESCVRCARSSVSNMDSHALTTNGSTHDFASQS